MCVVTITYPCPYPNVNNLVKRLQNPNEILPCYTVSCTKEHVFPHSCVVGVQHTDEEEVQRGVLEEVEPCSWCTSTVTWTLSETRGRKRVAGAAEPEDDGQGGRKSRIKKVKLDEEVGEDPACEEDYFATQDGDGGPVQCHDMAMDFQWTVPKDFDLLGTDDTNSTASESNFYNLPELGPITIEDIVSGGGLGGDTGGIRDHLQVDASESQAEDSVAMVDTPTAVESAISTPEKPAATAEWAFILRSPPESPHRFPTPAIEPTAVVAVAAADAEAKQRIDAVLLI